MNWPYGFQTHELREAFLKQEYKEGLAEHDYFKYYLPQPGEVYVEAGAYIGRNGYIAQAMGAHTILIEPNPLNLITLDKKIKDLQLTNTTVVRKALSNEKKIGWLILSNGNSSRLGEDGDRITPVQVDTLPNILKELKIEKVNLFACDIEGMETEIVKQLDPKIELHVAIASYHLGDPQNVEEKIMKLLENKTYKQIVYEEGVVFASATE